MRNINSDRFRQDIQIFRGIPEEAFAVSLSIPEFDPHYAWEKWLEHLADREVIVLIARVDGNMAGCKVGYFDDTGFYSWVGGVLPQFRRMGVAGKLADAQEDIVQKSGIDRIRMKTRRRFSEMLRFAKGRGFNITNVEEKGDPLVWRITLYKNL